MLISSRASEVGSRANLRISLAGGGHRGGLQQRRAPVRALRRRPPRSCARASRSHVVPPACRAQPTLLIEFCMALLRTLLLRHYNYSNYSAASGLASGYQPQLSGVSPSGYKPAKLEIDQAMAQWAAASAMTSADYSSYSGFFSPSASASSGHLATGGQQAVSGGGHYSDLRYPMTSTGSGSTSATSSSHRS